MTIKAKLVQAYAPASVSNLGAGFDVLGVALDAPGDMVIAGMVKKHGLFFHLNAPGMNLPTGKRENVAAYVASVMLADLKPPFGVDLTLYKGMPIGSGLGSSAASCVAAAMAVNALLAKPLPKERLSGYILEGERMASGSAHADNAAPSLFGGACLIRSYDPLDIERLPVKKNVWWVVVHPSLVVMTKAARAILPEMVPLKQAVQQWGNVGGLVAGLLSGDPQLIGRSMQDVIVEPVRAPLVRGFYKVRAAAIRAGAAGCTLSGSGPSMLAVAASRTDAEKIGAAMMKAFREHAGVESTVYLSRTNVNGAMVVEK